MMTLHNVVETVWKSYIRGGSKDDTLYALHRHLLDMEKEFSCHVSNKDAEKSAEVMTEFFRTYMEV